MRERRYRLHIEIFVCLVEVEGDLQHIVNIRGETVRILGELHNEEKWDEKGYY